MRMHSNDLLHALHTYTCSYCYSYRYRLVMWVNHAWMRYIIMIMHAYDIRYPAYARARASEYAHAPQVHSDNTM